MDIALVSSADSLTDIFPELEKFLRENIMHVGVKSFYSPTALEIPAVVKDLLDRTLVFVFLIAEKETPDVGIIKQKLLELEMQGAETKIVIGVEIAEDAGEAEAGKEDYVEKWGNHILDRLFHEERLKPGYEPGEESA